METDTCRPELCCTDLTSAKLWQTVENSSRAVPDDSTTHYTDDHIITNKTCGQLKGKVDEENFNSFGGSGSFNRIEITPSTDDTPATFNICGDSNYYYEDVIMINTYVKMIWIIQTVMKILLSQSRFRQESL